MTTAAKTTTPSVDISKFSTNGQNVRTMVADGFLFIAIKIDPETIKASRPSASGKSLTVGSTLGNVTVAEVPGLKIGVNAYVANKVLAPLAA